MCLLMEIFQVLRINLSFSIQDKMKSALMSSDRIFEVFFILGIYTHHTQSKNSAFLIVKNNVLKNKIQQSNKSSTE